MVRRSLALVGIAVTALLLLAPAASAQYVDDGTITIDDPNPDPGGAITVTGNGCVPGASVTVTITQGGQTVVIGTATAGATGGYSVNGSVPDNFVAGTAVISDTCGNSLTITIGGVSGTVTLPRTGSNTGTLWRIAVALVAAGGVLVLTARKRTAKVDVDA